MEPVGWQELEPRVVCISAMDDQSAAVGENGELWQWGDVSHFYPAGFPFPDRCFVTPTLMTGEGRVEEHRDRWAFRWRFVSRGDRLTIVISVDDGASTQDQP